MPKLPNITSLLPNYTPITNNTNDLSIATRFARRSFKFEKAMLFKFGTKPKKEWKAQDAGNFFIKFYLVTIIVTGLLSVYLFLGSTTHAKIEKLLNSTVEFCPDEESEATATCTTLNSTEIVKEVRSNKATRGEYI